MDWEHWCDGGSKILMKKKGEAEKGGAGTSKKRENGNADGFYIKFWEGSQDFNEEERGSREGRHRHEQKEGKWKRKWSREGFGFFLYKVANRLNRPIQDLVGSAVQPVLSGLKVRIETGLDRTGLATGSRLDRSNRPVRFIFKIIKLPMEEHTQLDHKFHAPSSPDQTPGDAFSSSTSTCSPPSLLRPNRCPPLPAAT